MSSSGIYDAFDAYLRALPHIPVLVAEGEAFNPQTQQPYVSSRMAAYTRRPVATGPNPVQVESGTFQINVHRPADEGRTLANQLADLLVAYFGRDKSITTADGLVVIFNSASAQPLIATGAFITMPILVMWQTTSF